MNCLIIDKVWGGIAEELSKCMNVKTADNLPSSKEQLIAEIGDVDVLIMRVDPKIDKEILKLQLFQHEGSGLLPEQRDQREQSPKDRRSLPDG